MNQSSQQKTLSLRFMSGAALAMIALALPISPSFAKDPGSTEKVGSAAAARDKLVDVSDAWIRATVPGQQATGGFMNLTASKALTLVGFESKVAGQAELHEMAMDGDVMRMRAIDGLPLPVAQKVSLKPGSHHLMLTDLKKALVVGQNVELTLVLKGEDGKVFKQLVRVPVKSPQMVPTPEMHHHHHHH